MLCLLTRKSGSLGVSAQDNFFLHSYIRIFISLWESIPPHAQTSFCIPCAFQNVGFLFLEQKAHNFSLPEHKEMEYSNTEIDNRSDTSGDGSREGAPTFSSASGSTRVSKAMLEASTLLVSALRKVPDYDKKDLAVYFAEYFNDEREISMFRNLKIPILEGSKIYTLIYISKWLFIVINNK